MAIPHGSGRVFKRGQTWWIAFMGPDPGDHTKRIEHRESTQIRVATATPPKDVLRLLHDRTHKVSKGEFISKAERVTFDDLVMGLKEAYKLEGRKSLETQQYHIKRLRPFFSRIAPVNYFPKLVKQYQTERRKVATVATVNREVACLNHMIKLAIDDHVLPFMPAFKLLPNENVREGFLKPDEFKKVLAELKGWRRNFVELAYLTGWRSGKIKDLTWQQVCLQEPVPYIRHDEGSATKKAPKDLPLTGRLLEIIKEQEACRSSVCPYVFHNNTQKIGNIRKAWYAACKRASVEEKIFIHDLRRSMARNLDANGVSTKVIMDRAGWRTNSMFLRYRIGDTAEQAKANAVMDQLMKE